MKGRWRAVNRVGKRGFLKGCWIVSPDGEIIATIKDGAIARQIAAAMNLTTQAQRTNFNATRAGYGGKQC